VSRTAAEQQMEVSKVIRWHSEHELPLRAEHDPAVPYLRSADCHYLGLAPTLLTASLRCIVCPSKVRLSEEQLAIDAHDALLWASSSGRCPPRKMLTERNGISVILSQLYMCTVSHRGVARSTGHRATTTRHALHHIEG